MKLAEALVERKAAQQKVAELNERLQRSALVQEGEAPAEAPATLLAELAEALARLEELVGAPFFNLNASRSPLRPAAGGGHDVCHRS